MNDSSITCGMENPPIDSKEVIAFHSPPPADQFQLPVLQTPSKVISSDSFIISDDFELPSSALKKEVAKFCDEINQSDIDFYDEITIEETELIIPDVNEPAVKSKSDEIKVVLASSLKDLSTAKYKDERKYQCGYCGHATTTKSCLMTHMTIHLEHMPFICKECNKGFLTGRNYKRHIKTPHRLGPHTCQHCDKDFSSDKLLRFHISRTHNKVCKFKCSECDYRAATLFELKRHAGRHWIDKQFKCSECPYQTHRKSNFNDHITMHSNARPFTCTVCSLAFKTENVLRVHLKTHDKQNKHSCEYCKLELSSARTLNKHITVFHDRNKPMYCKICQENLIDRGAYMEHRKQRAVNNQLRCEVKLCPYKAITQCKLSAHMLRHNAVKAQICLVCAKEFSNMLTLMAHLHTHADLIKCPDCGENFNKKGDIVVEFAVQNYNEDETKLLLGDNSENHNYNTASNVLLDSNKKETEEEPYVILEVLQVETQSGTNCVRYNLLRDTQNQQSDDGNEQKYIPGNVAAEDDTKSKELKVKCCNKVHKKMDIVERFEKYVNNAMVT